jgi:hypothetical protein
VGDAKRNGAIDIELERTMHQPLTAGLGLKPQHYDEALHCTASG